MKYEKVVIKQIPEDNGAAKNLKNYGRSRFPGCTDSFQVTEIAPGRYLTGLDPYGLEVKAIKDEDTREQIQKDREELLASLQSYINEDLSATSRFWQNYVVALSTDQDTILNRFNPADVIKYHVLLANGIVAPSLEDAGRTEFLQAKYYMQVEEVEEDQKVSTQKLRDQARAELYKIAENKDRLVLVGNYLEGGRYKKTMTTNTLYGMLSDFIDDKKNPDNVDSFVKAMKLSVEELQYKVTIETAIKKKIIKFKEGQYYRGGVNLGRNVIEVMRNLQLPDFANEFIAIHEDVQSR